MDRSSKCERRWNRKELMTRDEARIKLRSAASRGGNPATTFLRNHPKTSLVLAIGAGILLSASPAARKVALTATVQYFLRR